MSVLGDKLRCPHCLVVSEELEDPKQLPCSHVFCSPCLESLTKTEEGKVEITCSICSKCHEVDSLIDLPGLEDNAQTQNGHEVKTSSNIDVPKEEVKPEKRCDRCKEDTAAAVCYCVECDKKLCPRHEQQHQDYFCEEDQRHKLISIENYLLKPNLYIKPLCKPHKKEYSMCCKNCFCLRCKDCREDSKCEVPAGDKDHFYKSIQDMRAQLEIEFANLTKAVSDRVAEMCKLEKETWQKLDHIELRCVGLKQDVNIQTQRMITTIHEQQQVVLERIDKYVAEKRRQVEARLGALTIQREGIDGLRLESELMIANSHVTKIIEQRETTVKQLKEAVVPKSMSWSAVDLLLLEESLKMYMSDSMAEAPERVEFISSTLTGGICYTACFIEDGNLWVGCHDGIHEYSPYGKSCNLSSNLSQITSIARSKLKASFIAEDPHRKNTYRVHESAHINLGIKALFSLQLGNDHAPFLTSSKKYIAVTTDHYGIALYDVVKKNKALHKFAYQTIKLRFLSDEHLIVSDASSHQLHMYYIENINKLHLVWKCTGLEGVDGVCTTDRGQIVCTSQTKPVIYIVSAQGNLIKTLYSKKITPSWGQISIHGDILAVPCPDQDMFQLFKLKYPNLAYQCPSPVVKLSESCPPPRLLQNPMVRPNWTPPRLLQNPMVRPNWTKPR